MSNIIGLPSRLGREGLSKLIEKGGKPLYVNSVDVIKQKVSDNNFLIKYVKLKSPVEFEPQRPEHIGKGFKGDYLVYNQIIDCYFVLPQEHFKMCYPHAR